MMKFSIYVNKKHAIVIILLLIVSGFGIAQSTPNPGHSVNEVPGAARNCIANPSQVCNNTISQSGWNSWEVTSQAALSWDSVSSRDAEKLDGLDSLDFCRSNGNGCTTAIPVKGSVVGGGSDVIGSLACNIWGNAAYCDSSGQVVCASTSLMTTTKQYTGSRSVYSGTNLYFGNVYICVRN